MKPTPHASYSRRGSNSPLARGQVGAASGCRALAVAFAFNRHGLGLSARLRPTTGLPASARLGPPAPRAKARRKQAQYRAEPNAAAPWPSPPPIRRKHPPNLPDRTRGCSCSIRRGGSLAADHPKLRGVVASTGDPPVGIPAVRGRACGPRR